MFSQNLSSIDGVSIFPIISLVLFFAIFSGVLFWVLKKDKSYMENLANMPLQENNDIELNDESKNEK
ncbi:MAG: cbb3-type cytochrome c oxidase subunit 3 [Melioribacteraceae bacterium]|nr:cbb3-type cytochrome c oxidase subunit 3 [Melioribacteraceae bacterium]